MNLIARLGWEPPDYAGMRTVSLLFWAKVLAVLVLVAILAACLRWALPRLEARRTSRVWRRKR